MHRDTGWLVGWLAPKGHRCIYILPRLDNIDLAAGPCDAKQKKGEKEKGIGEAHEEQGAKSKEQRATATATAIYTLRTQVER